MTAPHTYITTTIPYVNARPHIGFALEVVQADVLARYRRQHGDRVRFQAGTDDNSLKNVLAAQAAGEGVREFVDRNAEAFLALGPALSLTVDDVIRTSRDARHRPGVERFWQACAAAGDLYRKRYEGLYCTGCEQFYSPAELRAGRCPEHDTEPQRVAEENWFFRLSRYGGALRAAITSGELRIEPAGRRNEVLAFIDGGLEDFSVSRPAERAGGWGIPVPGDPSQVIYVWFDALCNYVTALGYGTGDDAYRQWWVRRGPACPPARQGRAAVPRRLLAGDAAVVGTAAADGHRGARLPDGGRAEDQQVVRLRRRSGRAGRRVRHRRGALVAAPRGTAGRRRRLHRRADDRPRRRRAGQRPRQPGQPGGRHDPQVPGRPGPRTAARRGGRGRPRRGDPAGGRADRRGTGGLRLPAGHGGRLGDRGRGQPVHQPGPSVGAGPRPSGDAPRARPLDAVLGALFEACSALGRELAPFLPDAAERITGQCTPGATAGCPPPLRCSGGCHRGASARGAVSSGGGRVPGR